MQSKYLKIVAFFLLVVGVAISSYFSDSRKTNWEMLKQGNVEALTSSETENPYYPCIKAKGFCFMNGVDKDGIALVD